MLDEYFFRIFQHYKPKHKAKANNIALLYILVLQASLVLLIGSFFMLFFKQMHVDVLSTTKAWTLYILAIMFLLFRNWIYYTGKNRKVLNSKLKKSSTRKLWVLWCIPIVCFVFAILLMQRI